MTVHIIDQNILGKLLAHKPEQYSEMHRALDDMVRDGVIPGTGQVTLAGMLELFGFRFKPTNLINSANPNGPFTLPEVKKAVTQSRDIFSLKNHGKDEFFGLSEFRSASNKRIDRQLQFYKEQNSTPPFAPIFTNIKAIICDLTDDYLAGYWATRVMTSPEFTDKFVSELAPFFNQLLPYCLSNNIPCTRLVHRVASTILNGQSIPTLRPDEEHLDEDAIWYLLVGRSTRGNVHPITFITSEGKISEVLEYFTALMCGLDRHQLLPQSERLDSGPGTLLYVGEIKDGQRQVGRLQVSDYVKKAREVK